MSNKAYNVTAVQTATAVRTVIGSGTKQIKFRADVTVRGKVVSRTIVAQGKAADLISGMVRKGNTLNLRCVFERAPANEDGKRGGEFLSVVALPRAKAA